MYCMVIFYPTISGRLIFYACFLGSPNGDLSWLSLIFSGHGAFRKKQAMLNLQTTNGALSRPSSKALSASAALKVPFARKVGFWGATENLQENIGGKKIHQVEWLVVVYIYP